MKAAFHCLCILVCFPIAASAEWVTGIGVNFSDVRYNALSPNDTAGVTGYQQDHWNNTDQQTPATTFLDNHGAATTLGVNSGLASSFTQGAAAGPDELLFDGTLLSAPFLPATVTLTGIPYARYDLLVYVGNRSLAVNARPFFVNVAGQHAYGTVPRQSTSGYVDGDLNTPFTYVEAGYDEGSAVLNSNFALFKNLTASQLEIKVGSTDVLGSGPTISALQIIAVPEPSSIVLASAGAILGLAVAWRRITTDRLAS